MNWASEVTYYSAKAATVIMPVVIFMYNMISIFFINEIENVQSLMIFVILTQVCFFVFINFFLMRSIFFDDFQTSKENREGFFLLRERGIEYGILRNYEDNSATKTTNIGIA